MSLEQAVVLALAFGQEWGLPPGIVGVAAGAAALGINRLRFREMFVDLDWNSFLFIVGIFVVDHSLQATDLLREFAGVLLSVGLRTPALALAAMVWISVALSSFVDSVLFTAAAVAVTHLLLAIFWLR